MLSRLKNWAGTIKRDIHALYLAGRDPRVPWYAKALAVTVAAYAVSPIDLIPDFIPVFGYLDDIILLPIGIYLVIRLVPPDVMAECRMRADTKKEHPTSRWAAVIIIGIWLVSLSFASWFVYRFYLLK